MRCTKPSRLQKVGKRQSHRIKKKNTGLEHIYLLGIFTIS